MKEFDEIKDPHDTEGFLLTWDEVVEQWANSFIDTKEMEDIESYHGKLDYIKKYYERESGNILDTFQKSNKMFYNSYPLDWSKIMTPIEFQAWVAIRSKGIVLYPQYPVLNYHLDFANPGLMIALELDGAEWHDKERDLKRDNKLRELGWTVYRITGKEMYRDYKNFQTLREEEISDPEEMRQPIRHWIMETGDGVIEAIKVTHFGEVDHEFEKTEIGHHYYHFCTKTLIEHQLFN
jgi:very-short-patch-repair endonuclease